MQLTLTGQVRLRCTREHRALERLWGWCNELRNALCEQELSVRAYNRAVFLRHGTDWKPEEWASVLDPPDGRVVAHARRAALGKQWTEVRGSVGGEGFDPCRYGVRMASGVFDDYVRRYQGPAPAPKYRAGWKLDSVLVKDARLEWKGRRDAVLRVQGLPALRVRLHRPLPQGAAIRTSLRLVRSRRGCRGRCATRYEVRVGVDVADRPVREIQAERGWDPGGRRSLTSDRGDVVVLAKRDRSETKRLRRTVARCKKGSRGYHKAQAKLRCHLERETRSREQHRRKQVAHAARKAELHVVEDNDHAAMRRAGPSPEHHRNRSMAEAGPARTVALLEHACRKTGRRLVKVPADGNSGNCSACGSDNARLTRTRLRCWTCGHTEDRDRNAARNALHKHHGAVPAPARHNREVAARPGTAPAPQCPVAPESLGANMPLARRGPGKPPDQPASSRCAMSTEPESR